MYWKSWEVKVGQVVSIENLTQLATRAHSEGKRVVHCHGVFDLLHVGHIRHLRAARRMGDVLVVTVTPDRFVNKGPGRPAFGEILRAEVVAALAAVDYVAVSLWPTAIEAINLIRPAFYVKGVDYLDPSQDLTGKIVDERRAVEANGGEMRFTDEVTVSSSQLLNRYFSIYPDTAASFLAAFRERYPAHVVIEALERLRGLRALVVGETIVDEYHYCQPEGSSPKSGLVVHRYLEQESFVGGAAMTAAHMAGFVKEVTLATAFALNQQDAFKTKLGRPNLQMHVFDAPTIVKRRFMVQQAVFAVEYLDGNACPELVNFLETEAGNFDLVVVNDFGHGLMTPEAIAALSGARFLAINAQTNSMNRGFNLLSQKYPRADFVCQDELEVRLDAHDKTGPLDHIADSLVRKMQARMVAITTGKKGCTVYGEQVVPIPALTREVVDTMGTGDAYLALAAPCVAAGLPLDMTGFVGVAISALHAQTVGNRHPVEPSSLLKFISALLK